MAMWVKAKRKDVIWIGNAKLIIESLGEQKVTLLVEGPEGTTIEREAFIRRKNPSDPRLPENIKK